MTIIGIARAGRGRSRNRGTAAITLMEARLLTLRPAGASGIALPTRREDARPRSAAQPGRRIAMYAQIAFWLVVLTTFALGSYVIDRGGHSTRIGAEDAPEFASGSGRMAVTAAQGDVTVRVTVRAAAGPWFWCLESSRGLPPEQHLCRNSGEAEIAGRPAVTDGAVHLDAASVRDAAFYVQMYCRDGCDWRAETEPAAE